MHDGAVIPSSDGDHRAVIMSEVLTARLRLAPVGEADLEELFTLHADPRAFADDLTEPLTDGEQMRWVLAQWLGHWRRHGRGYVTVRARGRESDALPGGLLGVVGLAPLEADGHAVLSAYWRLVPAATGRGVATEALRAVLDHPRWGPGEQEVLAVTAAGNAPSRAVAARAGFRPAPSERAVPGGREGDVLLVRPGRPWPLA